MDKKKSKQQDVLVIGAGASGMMTAITAARRGLSVTVLEHMDKPGKKILATGNGKCNFTNLKMSPRCYYGDHGLVQEILKQFTVEDTLAFFREIGIWPKEKNGYVYPNSGIMFEKCSIPSKKECSMSSVIRPLRFAKQVCPFVWELKSPYPWLAIFWRR